jgi:CubicO group peptidase (beta-lactamase class C family)/Tol biopolymer transport system component/ketosteroid isomerase-like protein
MSTRVRVIAAVTFAAATVASIAGAQADPGQPVIAARLAYNEAIAKRDPVGMRAVLSPTFHMVLGRSSQNHGADQTMARMQATFATDSLYSCVRTPDHVDVNAAWGLAQESGHWRCRYAGVPAGAPEGYATGTYNAKWQRDTGGSWRLQAEIFTTLECVGQSTACAKPDAVPASATPLPAATGSSAEAVRAARLWYNAAMKRGDADAIVSLYTPDFHAVFGRGRHIEGVEAARADWRTNDQACVRTSDSVTVNEGWGLAHERGHWSCQVTMNGVRATPSGLYFAKWERDVAGRWRTQAEVYTTMRCEGPAAGCIAPDPLPPATPATRRESFTVREGTWMAVDAAPNGQALAFELLGDVYTLPMAGGQATPILTGKAWQSQPRYSPDGSKIAYISDGSGSDNVWIANANGSNARALSTMPRAVMVSPAWTPDGSAIYATVIDNRIAELWRFDVATGAGTKVVSNNNGQPSGLVSAPSPGPYSAHVARDGALWYTSVTPRAYGVRAGAASAVVRRDPATNRDEPVTLEEFTAMAPVTSADGKWLVYAAQSRGKTGLRVRDLATATERWLAYPIERNQLESRASRDVVPGYSITPDSKAVLASYGGQIHRVEIATGADAVIPFSATFTTELPAPLSATRRLADGPVKGRMAQQVAVARDGRVAYSMMGRIYVATPGAGVPKRLTTTADPREFMPAWSPDGQWIAYVTWTPEGGQVWKAKAAGGAPVRLTDAPAMFIDPVWSPDGQTIYAVRSALGSARVQMALQVPTDARLVRVAAGTAPAPVTVFGPVNGARHPHFGADTSRVYLSGPAGITSVNRSGAEPRVESRGRVPGADARVSPDGTKLLVQAGDRLFTLPMPARSGAEPPAVELTNATLLQAGSTTAFSWTPSGGIVWTSGANVHVRDGVGAERTASLSVEIPRVTGTGVRVLRGATAITMKGAEIIRNADIVVTNDRITAIGARGSVTIPAGASLHDVSGTTIMPGIVDIHAHWQVRRDLLEPETPSTYANLAYGVTTIRDPQTVADIFGYSDLVEVSGTPSPRITSTGPGLFTDLNPQSLDEARALVKRYRDDYGTWLLKNYLIGSRQQREWLVQASREFGMLPTSEGGSDDKLDLTHALDGFAGNEHALPTAPLYDDAVQLLARSGTTYTPTLLVSFGGALPIYRLHATERPADEPKLQRFFPRSELFARTATRLLAFPDEDYNDKETSAGAAAVLHAGGKVALGGHGEMQGLQVHWEMRLLAQGGMTNHEVLQVATRNGAEAIGLGQDIGTLEVGKLADLLVLDRDPLADIRNTTSIRWVMRGGMLYDAETLDEIAPTSKPLPAPWWRADVPRSSVARIDEAAVDRAVTEEMRRQNVPGVGLAVLRGNEVVMAKGYGMANIEQQIKVSPATMFESGSLGKMFTSAGVMAMVEAGQIGLDSSVRVYLPDAPAAWQPIKIRHLLSHTSGIPDYTTGTLDYRRDFTEAQLQQLAYGLPLEFAPGTRWNYSNTGYTVLGTILSKVAGKPYWEFLRERIFTPAGMRTVRIISEKAIVPNRASGYLPGEYGFEHQDWVSPTLNTTADGSLLISINDLIAWSRVVRDRAVLSKASWDVILSPMRLNSGRTHPYGFGWFLDTFKGERVIQHGGSWQGFRTQLTRFEQHDLTVVVLTNGGHVAPDAIANKVAAAADSALTPVPLPTGALPNGDPKAEAALRAILLKAADGTMAISDFEFVRGSVVPRMAAAYSRTLKPLGALQRLELVQDRGLEGDDHAYLYRAVYEKGPMLVQTKIGPGGGVTQLVLVR